MPYRLPLLSCSLLLILLIGLAGCDPEQTSRPASSRTSSPPKGAIFTDATEATRLDFVHDSGLSGERYMIEVIGSGLALFDYDQDGDLDLYMVQGHALDEGAATTPRAIDRLYRNDLIETDTLRFTDVTETSGLRADGYGMGVATGDYNNDGWTDLYVLNWDSNQLWRNNGDGTFTDVTAASQTDDRGWSTAASFLDYDRDGWLDLMVVNYIRYDLAAQKICYAAAGHQEYCGPDAYPDAPDQLLHNQGDGTFASVTLPMGMTGAYGSGLGVVAADFNEDGWPDLYVTNDGDENQLWMNQAGQRFENRALAAGAAVNAAGSTEASMGVSTADFDGDGHNDLFMTRLDTETNTFYRNAGGRGIFEDRSRASGLGLPSRPFTAFGIATLDYDNDGWLDLFIANGAVHVVPTQQEQGIEPPLRQTDQLFRNLGEGRFAETTQEQDGLFDEAAVGRGVATGDLDNDGDTDIILSNNHGPARVLRNDAGSRQPWLGLRLLDTEGRRDMLGARVGVLRTGAPDLWRRVHTDGSYASASDPRVLFGLGETATYDTIQVFWPDGTEETWANLALNQYHTLIQGQGTASTP